MSVLRRLCSVSSTFSWWILAFCSMAVSSRCAQRARRRRSTGSASPRRTSSSGEDEVLGVECLVEDLLDLRLGHGAAAQPDAGEEHLLVQPQAAEPDEDQPRYRRHARLRQLLDHDCGDAVHRGVNVEQGGAQDAGRALEQGVPEVDVDDVVAPLGYLLVERDRAQDTRVQPGLQAAQRELPRRA